jgi:hypothetical protein
MVGEAFSDPDGAGVNRTGGSVGHAAVGGAVTGVRICLVSNRALTMPAANVTRERTRTEANRNKQAFLENDLFRLCLTLSGVLWIAVPLGVIVTRLATPESGTTTKAGTGLDGMRNSVSYV